MNWLTPDSKFMRAWSSLVDGVWINIPMLVASIPLITIGMVPAADHDACRYSTEGEGKSITANYFKLFKANLIRATLPWPPLSVVLVVLAWSWIVLQITPPLIIKFALTVLQLIGFEWTFALRARFESIVVGISENASIFGISHIAVTVALVIVDAVSVVLLVAGWFYMSDGLSLLAIPGYGITLMFHILITERVFNPYPIDQAGFLANIRRSSRSERSPSAQARQR